MILQTRKTALITGGTSGIGLATAQMLVAKGYFVAIMGRNHNRGKRAMALLPPDKAMFIAGDVTETVDCQNAVSECFCRFGSLNTLINSAGVYEEHALSDTSDKEFSRLMNVNMGGTFRMCRTAEYCLRMAGGAIVNVASDAGLRGNYNCAAYAATKGAVIAFTKSLALELAMFNIRVNAVAPGDILTPLTEKQLQNAPQGRAAALNLMQSVYPLGRIGTAEETAAVIAFLASDDAAFVTGAVWSVDGGLTA